MTADPSHESRVARLEARVEELEALLARRSAELRLIQSHVCHRDLVVISRIMGGYYGVPFGPFDPDFWPETTSLAGGEVPETLAALWRSLRPQAEPPEDDA